MKIINILMDGTGNTDTAYQKKTNVRTFGGCTSIYMEKLKLGM